MFMFNVATASYIEVKVCKSYPFEQKAQLLRMHWTQHVPCFFFHNLSVISLVSWTVLLRVDSNFY